MASETEICSIALNQIGGEPINSLDDDSKRAKACKIFYPMVRDAVLRAYPWNCAKYRVALARSAESPPGGADYDFAYQYPLPVNPYCLWVPKQLNENISYKIERRMLLCDEAYVTIVCIVRITDPGLFDSLLMEAIAARLASELAYPIAGNVNLAISMWRLYEAKLREARTVDGMEGDISTYESNALINVR